MILNNFDIIETLLKFDENVGDPIYYQIDLIERKKDGVKTTACQNSARRITSFYPQNMEQWNKYKARIIDLCDARPGLRAYINPNPKRGSSIMKQMMVDLADRFAHDANTGLQKFFESAVAKTKPTKGDSIWVIDLDCDDNFDMKTFINEFVAKFPEADAIANPSRTGWHLLCKPFNRNDFKNWMTEKGWAKKADEFIHVNALTNLYTNTGE